MAGHKFCTGVLQYTKSDHEFIWVNASVQVPKLNEPGNAYDEPIKEVALHIFHAAMWKCFNVNSWSKSFISAS